MNVVYLVLILLLLVNTGLAQKGDDRLATAGDLIFTANSLSGPVQKMYLGRAAAIAAKRKDLLDSLVRETALAAEAKGRGISPDTLLAGELKNIPAPTTAEIQKVYDANRTALGGRPLAEVRPQIASFLRVNAERKAIAGLIDGLKAKHKYAAGKDINAADLAPADVIFSFGGTRVTAADFGSRFAADLYDAEAEIAAYVTEDLDRVIFSALVSQEAKANGQDPAGLLANEITNKLKDFSDEERQKLEDDLKRRLFAKYAVKILFSEPPPVAHDVSADDDPSLGDPKAPVTVIMFSDFQCPSCSAAHPVLRSVLAGYGSKVRLVVRDFPLEGIHENAFRAALAAQAAHLQGKFLEYTEVLYHHQDALDEAALKRYAAELGLNARQFAIDFSSEKTAAEVRKDIADGMEAGITGTPTIFVNGVKLQALSADSFRKAIDRALALAATK